MGETLKQPLAPGLEVVDSTASGGTEPITMPKCVGYYNAIDEVLELIEDESFDEGRQAEDWLICDYENIKTKIEAMRDK